MKNGNFLFGASVATLPLAFMLIFLNLFFKIIFWPIFVIF